MVKDVQLATPDELFGRPTLRRFKGGPDDPGDPIVLPVSQKAVRIRSLTERELSDYQMATVAKKGDGLKTDRLRDANRRLISLCLVDGEGNPYVNAARMAEMADWDSADTTFLYDECAKHCGIARGEIEDLVKNSETTPVVA